RSRPVRAASRGPRRGAGGRVEVALGRADRPRAGTALQGGLVPLLERGARPVLHATPPDLGRRLDRPVPRRDGGPVRGLLPGPGAEAAGLADELRRFLAMAAGVAAQRR